MHPKSLKNLLAISMLLAVAGCSTQKNFEAIDGSRGDGTIEMAYEYQQFEKPVVSMEQARSAAKARCKAWGYNDAEAFGGKSNKCYQRDAFGSCLAGQVVVKYQCLGNLNASGQPAAQPAARQPAATPAYQAAGQQMTEAQWREAQLQQLQNEQGISYEEYQRRYRMIMGR